MMTTQPTPPCLMPDPAISDLTQEQRIREEERARIARDLHDELGAQLVGIGMALGQLQEQLKAEGNTGPALGQANYAGQLLKQAHQSMDQIIDDLRPPIVEFGLVDALAWQCRQVTRQSGLRCTLESPSALPLQDEFVVVSLLRIAREALNNAVRHAQAGQIVVKIELADSRLTMTIADDGTGFDPQAAPAGRHGLLNMRQRARALGATLTLERPAEGGSTIALRMPVAP
ncbi:sensor histidine kinase [Herbaspirillum sp. AP21]|uniref:sensor histidine kinase n=2 Tax=unclassified Herbaspirillum TaxID=2624150 RepID=UPI002104F641|nr:sensor histidine kinase [Herbaspirillum sp. AP21]